uniref:Integrase core domain containing protein n=1 Tax=Solanum tuberosum TaxID=4113 RepID=M1DFX5_SOLTU
MPPRRANARNQSAAPIDPLNESRNSLRTLLSLYSIGDPVIVERSNKILKEIKEDVSTLSQTVTSHSVSIKQLETQMGQKSYHLNSRQKRGLPSDTMVNPKNEVQVWKVFEKSRVASNKSSHRAQPNPSFDSRHLQSAVCKTQRAQEITGE